MQWLGFVPGVGWPPHLRALYLRLDIEEFPAAYAASGSSCVRQLRRSFQPRFQGQAVSHFYRDVEKFCGVPRAQWPPHLLFDDPEEGKQYMIEARHTHQRTLSLHCTARQCTSWHCTALHAIVLHRGTAPRGTALRGSALRGTARHCDVDGREWPCQGGRIISAVQEPGFCRGVTCAHTPARGV